MRFLVPMLAASTALYSQQTLSPSDLNRVAVGAKAPDFELPTAEGQTVRLSSLQGKNIILVFYRGYW
jgi:cytochrome oxidase Cu insertion factor (SCO1/SenC/PrrC family)